MLMRLAVYLRRNNTYVSSPKITNTKPTLLGAHILTEDTVVSVVDLKAQVPSSSIEYNFYFILYVYMNVPSHFPLAS